MDDSNLIKRIDMPKFAMSKYPNQKALMKAREDFLVQNHMPHLFDDDLGRMGFAAGYNEAVYNIAFSIESPNLEVNDGDAPAYKAFVLGYDLAVKEHGVYGEVEEMDENDAMGMGE